MSDEPATPAPAPAAEPIPGATPLLQPPPARRWSTFEMWTLGLFSALGIVGFVATFVLIVMRSPHAEVPRALTAVDVQSLPGPRGERGPAGPPGPAGPAGAGGDVIRVVRTECTPSNCAAECNDDEILLSAYCSPSRTPVSYTSERGVTCRTAGRSKVEVVAACLRAKP